MSVVGFVGSRSLPSSPAPRGLVSSVVGSLWQRGWRAAVGCSVGADAAVLRALGRLGPVPSSSGYVLWVFAAFGPDGGGAWRGSAVPLVSRLAASPVWSASPGHGLYRPALVRWWSGGGADVPLRDRLRGRTEALVAFLGSARASSGRASLVAFVAGGPDESPGSWLAVRLAVEASLPVVVFPVGWGGPLPAVADGVWVSAGSGVWARGWRWEPEDNI